MYEKHDDLSFRIVICPF